MAHREYPKYGGLEKNFKGKQMTTPRNEAMEAAIELLNGAATALDSQWCENDKNALRELAKRLTEGKVAITDEDNTQYDRLVEILLKEADRYFDLDDMKVGAVDTLRAIIKDRDLAYEQLNILLQPANDWVYCSTADDLPTTDGQYLGKRTDGYFEVFWINRHADRWLLAHQFIAWCEIEPLPEPAKMEETDGNTL